MTFGNEDAMNEWVTAHSDVIRTDFKRKLRYPAVDRRAIVKEPVLVEDNKRCIQEARAYLKARRQTVDEYISP